MSVQIEMPGLLGSHPLAALASFGLLRLVSCWDGKATLQFRMKDDWIAVLHTTRFHSANALIDMVGTWALSDEPDSVLRWANDVRVEPNQFRRILTEALKNETPLLAAFLGALATEGAKDSQKGRVKPSAFYMVSGLQSFLNGMRAILTQVRSNPQSIFEEALLGPWRYSTRLHGMGWDPNTERLHALRHCAPTSEDPSCIAGAVLLALWALPFFPVVSYQGRARTVGFTQDKDGSCFCWPVFSTAIDSHSLRSLLQAGARRWRSHGGRLRPGIAAVFRSRRAEFGQGYAVLRPSEVLHQQK